MLVGVKLRRGHQQARNRANLHHAVHAHDEQHRLERRFSIEQTHHAIEELHASARMAGAGAAAPQSAASGDKPPSSADLLRVPGTPAQAAGAPTDPPDLSNSKWKVLASSFKRSSLGDVANHVIVRQATRHKYFVHPESGYKVMWDILISFFIVYSCLDVPFRIGFNQEATGFFWWFDMFIDLSFFCDIVLNFRTAYYDRKGLLVWNACRIARHYLQGAFVLDLVSTVPFNMILSFLVDGNSSILRSTKLLRALRLIRLLRLMRLIKLGKFFSRFAEDVTVNQSLVQLGKMSGVILVCGHLLGCGWFWVSSFTDGMNWVNANGVDQMALSQQYVVSLYWAFTTMTTVGYGDVNATNTGERVMALLSMLVGASIFGYVVGNVTMVVESINAQASLRKEKMDSVKEFVRDRQLPPYMKTLVMRHFKFFFGKKSVFDEATMLDNMPSCLRGTISQFNNERMIAATPLFDHASPMIVSTLLTAMRPFTLPAGHCIYQQGDVGTELLLVVSGDVALLWDPTRVDDVESLENKEGKPLNLYERRLGNMMRAYKRAKVAPVNGRRAKKAPIECGEFVTDDQLYGLIQVRLLHAGSHFGSESAFEADQRLTTAIAATDVEIGALKKDDLFAYWQEAMTMLNDEAQSMRDRIEFYRKEYMAQQRVLRRKSTSRPANGTVRESPVVAEVEHEDDEPVAMGGAAVNGEPSRRQSGGGKRDDGAARGEDGRGALGLVDGGAGVSFRVGSSGRGGDGVAGAGTAGVEMMPAGSRLDASGGDKYPPYADMRVEEYIENGGRGGSPRASVTRTAAAQAQPGTPGNPVASTDDDAGGGTNAATPNANPGGLPSRRVMEDGPDACAGSAGGDADAGAGGIRNAPAPAPVPAEPEDEADKVVDTLSSVPPYLRPAPPGIAPPVGVGAGAAPVGGSRSPIPSAGSASSGRTMLRPNVSLSTRLDSLLDFYDPLLVRDSRTDEHMLLHTDSWQSLRRAAPGTPASRMDLDSEDEQQPPSRAHVTSFKSDFSKSGHLGTAPPKVGRRVIKPLAADAPVVQSWMKRHTVHPHDPRRLKWDLVLTIIIIYSAVMVPYRIGFKIDAAGAWEVIDYATDCLFALDIIINFFTGYISDLGNCVRDPPLVATHYLKGWFTIDFLSTFPFDWSMKLIMQSSSSSQFRLTKLLRTLRLFRLLKLARFIKLEKLFGHYEDAFSVHPSLVRMAKLTVVMLFIAHINGCLWFGITDGGGEGTWVAAYCDSHPGSDLCPEGLSFVSQYMASVYWAFTTMTTVGYGDITPDKSNPAELIVAMLSMVLGTTVFAHVITSVMGMVINFDPAQRLTKQALVQLNDYMKEKRLPTAFRRQLRDHYRHYLDVTSVLPQTSLLYDQMPAHLRDMVVRHCFRHTLYTIPLLKRCEAHFNGLVSYLALMMKPARIAKGAVVVRLNDTQRNVFFVVSGLVHVYDDTRKLLRTAVDGQFFGESALWTSESVAYRSKVSARAGFVTHLFYLSRNDFLQLRMSICGAAATYLEQRLKAEGNVQEWATNGEDESEEEEATGEGKPGEPGRPAGTKRNTKRGKGRGKRKGPKMGKFR